MGLKEDFDQAAEKVKRLQKTPDNDNLLVLYALFKQSNVGNNNTEKPGLLDFKGKAKWEAWNKLNGMSNDEAMQKYIEKVEELVVSIGLA